MLHGPSQLFKTGELHLNHRSIIMIFLLQEQVSEGHVIFYNGLVILCQIYSFT